MPVVVQKYGGTSVADPARISAVADLVGASRRAGNDVVVVVSAMGQTTDELIALAADISPKPPPRRRFPVARFWPWTTAKTPGC